MPRKQDITLWDWQKLAINSWDLTWNINPTFYRLAIYMNVYNSKMIKIWLLPCHLLPKMYLAHSCLISLQKPYDPMVILCATGNAEKARYYLVRLTKTCNQLVRTHMKYKSDLLPSGDIWPCDSSYKLAANPHRIWYITLNFRYLYCLTAISKIFWCDGHLY